MPTVTFLGPFYSRNCPVGSGSEFIRMVPQEKSQSWLDRARSRLPASHWRIEGDEGVHHDEGGDGIPDEGWTKSKINEWIVANGGKVVKSYRTKTQLLAQVDTILNPPAPEPVVEEAAEEPVAEEVVEEAVEEATTTEE